MKIGFINFITIILLNSCGLFLNAMEHEDKCCSSVSSSLIIEDHQALPDILYWTIDEMCKNDDYD